MAVLLVTELRNVEFCISVNKLT